MRGVCTTIGRTAVGFNILVDSANIVGILYRLVEVLFADPPIC